MGWKFPIEEPELHHAMKQQRRAKGKSEAGVIKSEGQIFSSA
jgi:hypothetical protein